MPYCPKCGGEYREGFRECSDCLLELVDTPPKDPRPPGLDDEDDKPDKKKEGKKPSAIDNTASCTSCRPQVNLAMVFKARSDMEAIEVKSMLAGSNISAIAAESGGQQGEMEVPVFVDENDAADARELIRTSYGKAVEDGEDETVIYEMEEGEDLTVEEDEEEEEDDVVEEQYASTIEEKSEELRRRMGGTDSNRGLLIVSIVVVIIVLIVLYLHYG
ncbi:MAG: hypothetical protein ABIH66_02670 [bacterium]